MEPLKQSIQKTDYNPPSLLKVYKATNGLSLEDLEMLIRKFAPIVCLHPGSIGASRSVLDYFQKAKLISHSEKRKTGFDVSNFDADTKGTFYLEPAEMSTESRLIEFNKCYVHAKKHHEHHTDFQYWFFQEQTGSAQAHVKWLIDGTIKGYDGKIELDPLGKYQGSWDRITVRVNNETKNAEQVFFSALGKGTWVPINKLQHRAEQVIVFSSKNGNGFYPGPGCNQREKVKFDLYSSQLELGIHDDIGNGKEINFSEFCELVSAPYLRVDKPIEPFWLNFQHHWGNPNPDCLSVPAIKRLIPPAFGKSLEFLLSKELLDALVNYLLFYFSEECREKTMGPKFRKCWDGDEES